MGSSHNVDILPLATAAELVNVSRPHLLKILKEGEISFHMVGPRRRVRIQSASARGGHPELHRSGPGTRPRLLIGRGTW
ncbi:MAG: excisionase family DNA-binding protein [Salinibacter sp.]